MLSHEQARIPTHNPHKYRPYQTIKLAKVPDHPDAMLTEYYSKTIPEEMISDTINCDIFTLTSLRGSNYGDKTPNIDHHIR